MFADRARLGDAVTLWLAERPQLDIVDIVVTQSSDAAFHYLAISIFYFERVVMHERRSAANPPL